MRKALHLTTALYPAMVLTLALSFLLSSRTSEAGERVRDRVFPVILYRHPLGSGTFLPGSFAVNFFAPSLLLMLVANVVFPRRVHPLRSATDSEQGRAAGGSRRPNIFYYVLGLIVAIVEVGADTTLPLIALPGRWGLSTATALVHGTFLGALAVAMLVSRGASGEW